MSSAGGAPAPDTEPGTAVPVTAAEVGASVRWSYAAAAATGVVQLLLAAVLTRLLSPDDYGVVGVAAGTLRFLQYLADLGIASTLIQKRDLDRDRDVPILFAGAVAANLVLVGLVWIAAPGLQALVPNLPDEGVTVIRALALVAVVGSVGQAAVALMRRDLDFRAIGIQSFVSTLIGQGAVAVPLAYLGAGAWSLVAGTAAQTALVALLALLRVRPALRPRRIAAARLRALIGMSGGFSMLRILDSATMHLLPVVVGIFAGVGAVGLWDRAFVLAFLPLEALAAGVGQVLLPVYGRLANDPDRLRRAWSSVIALAACLLGGIAVGVAVAAPLIVAVVLGPGWVAAAEPLRLLSFWALLRTLSYIAGPLCEARGWLLPRGLQQVAYLVGLGAALTLARPADLVGVIEVLLAVEAVSQTALLVMASRACGAAPLAVLSSVLAALMPALLVGAGTAGVSALTLAFDLPSPLALAAAMAAGGILLPAGILLHPSASLRHAVADRLLGPLLGFSTEGGAFGARLRRWLRR